MESREMTFFLSQKIDSIVFDCVSTCLFNTWTGSEKGGTWNSSRNGYGVHNMPVVSNRSVVYDPTNVIYLPWRTSINDVRF